MFERTKALYVESVEGTELEDEELVQQRLDLKVSDCFFGMLFSLAISQS